MARTDASGRSFMVVLTYLLNRQVTIGELHEALGISRSTFERRSTADDFPNAEECRLIGLALGLNPLDLMARFGLIEPDDFEGFLNGPFATKVAERAKTIDDVKKKSRVRFAELQRRREVPPP